MEIKKINELLATHGCVFRVEKVLTQGVGFFEKSKTVYYIADFVAYIGPVAGFKIYIDSFLQRYLRTNDGQFYQCTDKDLTGMHAIAQEKYIQELTGLYN